MKRNYIYIGILSICITGLGLTYSIQNQGNQNLGAPVTLEQRLENLSANQRAKIKVTEIVRSFPGKRANEQRSKYKIEITNVQEVDEVLEVYARAYQNGKQIGFGKDGTVDIERFRFVNPPVLVEDPNGVIVRSHTDDITGELSEKKFREDPREALLQSIEHTLDVKTQKHDSGRIIAGKIGRTTTTVYSDANPETTTVDGGLYRYATDASFSAARSNASASTDGDAETQGSTQNAVFAGSPYLRREFNLFDTSSITDTDTIDSATISIYRTGNFNDTNDMSMVLIQTNPASNNDLVLGDYDAITLNNPDEGASRFDITGSTNNAYNDISFNSTGLGWIDKTGITKLGFRGSYDVDNGTPTGFNNMNYALADTAGTTQDPKLVIEHSAGGGGGITPRTYVTPVF